MIFRLDAITKEFGTQALFRDVSAQCNEGERIGLIGRNGTGKTTLFDIIEGAQLPDGGEVRRASNLEIGRIAQIPHFAPGATVRQEALKVFDYLRGMRSRIREIEHEMGEGEVSEPLAREYDQLTHRLRLSGGYDYEARTEAVLLGVGFAKEMLDAPCGRLSGGQKNRLLVARTLLRPCDLLLLDEPTNHLDLRAILWLSEYLKELKSAYLVVSHDRRFLDDVTESTWELEGKRLHVYKGSFTPARRQREKRLEQLRADYQRQQEWKAKTEDFIRRNIVGQKTKQAQARRKQLDKTEWIEKPAEDRSNLLLKIDEGRRGGALTFRLENADIGYPSKTLLEGVSLTVTRSERIGFVGGNGSGKTTLLKTLAGELPVLSGTMEWGPNNDLAYYPQEPRLGGGDETVYDVLRRLDPRCTDEELRGFAALFLFRGNDIRKPVAALSGGELSRLALAQLCYESANVLILDEPTNHLDIAAREALEEMLSNYGGTLIVVSHDLYFLRNVVDQYYWLREGSLRRLESLSDLHYEEKAAAKQAAPSPSVPSPKERPGRSVSKNRLRKMREQIEDLESRVSQLESQKSSLEDLLQNPDHPFEKLRDLSRQHEKLGSQLDDLYWQWEEKSRRLAELEK